MSLPTPNPTNLFLLDTLASPSPVSNPRVIPDYQSAVPLYNNPYSIFEHTQGIATPSAGASRGSTSNDETEYSSLTDEGHGYMGVVVGVFVGVTGLIVIASVMLVLVIRRRGRRNGVVKEMELGYVEGGVKALDPPPPYERVGTGDGRREGQVVED